MEESEVKSVCERLERAFRLLDNRFILYQYLFRRKGYEMPGASVRKGRAELLSGLYRNQSYAALVRVSSVNDAQPSYMPAGTYRRLRGGLDGRRLDLEQAVEAWLEDTRSFWPMKLASRQETFDCLWRLFNHTGDPRRLLQDIPLGEQLAEPDPDFSRMTLGEKHFAVVSLKQLPKATPTHRLTDLLAIEADVNLCVQHTALPYDVQKTSVNSAKGSQITREVSGRAHAEAIKQKVQILDRMRDQGAVSNVESLADSQRKLERRDYLCQLQMTMAVFADSRRELDLACQRVQGVMNRVDCRMHREGINRKAAFFSMHPGAYRHNHRWPKMHNSNAARFSLCIGVDQGQTWSPHLHRESLITFETRQKTPYHFNWHHLDVGHFHMAGATGYGKSFLLNDLIDYSQQYNPLTFIFDMGGSFEFITRKYGGIYNRITMESQNLKLNPLAWPDSREQRNFLTVLIRTMLRQGEYRVTKSRQQQIYAAISDVYKNVKHRRLRDVVERLPQDMQDELALWAGPESQYGWAVDNEEDSLSDAQFVTLDMKGMETKKDLCEVLFMCAFQAATVRVSDPSLIGQLKMAIFDEAWVFVRDETAAELFIEPGYLTFRKYNAFVGLSTQNPKHLKASPIFDTILQNSVNKFHLYDPEADEALYRETYHYNPALIKAIREVTPQRDFVLVPRGKKPKTLSLRVTDEEYWQYANDANAIARRNKEIALGGDWLGRLVAAGRDGHGSANGQGGVSGRESLYDQREVLQRHDNPVPL
jgi:type IV secretion system protein TrbE